jgi:serine phosphatase RsbU (regulator of sigma subunit)
LVYVVFERDGRHLRIANAGHPPPILVDPRGEITFLTDGLSVPLGVTTVASHREATYEVERGSYLLLYSDGLVEDRTLAIQDGLHALAGAAANFRGTPDELCDRVLSTIRDKPGDDICLLAVAIQRVGDGDTEPSAQLAPASKTLTSETMRPPEPP